MKHLKTIFFLTGLFIIGSLTAQSKMDYRNDIDTLYHAPQDKEIFFYNGFEPPERYDVEFVRKEGDDKVPFKIDKTCELNDPKSCVSLYHFVNEEGTATKWLLRGSTKSKDGLEVVYGQRVGKDGKIIYSETSVEPGEVIDLGYAKLEANSKDKKVPTERFVWIVSANWK